MGNLHLNLPGQSNSPNYFGRKHTGCNLPHQTQSDLSEEPACLGIIVTGAVEVKTRLGIVFPCRVGVWLGDRPGAPLVMFPKAS